MTREQIQKAMTDNPSLNTTELAMRLTGITGNPYKSDNFKEYQEAIHIINSLKEDR